MKEKPGKLKEHTGKLKASMREKPGNPREQTNIKENVKNMNYKRLVCMQGEQELEKL